MRAACPTRHPCTNGGLNACLSRFWTTAGARGEGTVSTAAAGAAVSAAGARIALGHRQGPVSKPGTAGNTLFVLGHGSVLEGGRVMVVGR